MDADLALADRYFERLDPFGTGFCLVRLLRQKGRIHVKRALGMVPSLGEAIDVRWVADPAWPDTEAGLSAARGRLMAYEAEQLAGGAQRKLPPFFVGALIGRISLADDAMADLLPAADPIVSALDPAAGPLTEFRDPGGRRAYFLMGQGLYPYFTLLDEAGRPELSSVNSSLASLVPEKSTTAGLTILDGFLHGADPSADPLALPPETVRFSVIDALVYDGDSLASYSLAERLTVAEQVLTELGPAATGRWSLTAQVTSGSVGPRLQRSMGSTIGAGMLRS